MQKAAKSVKVLNFPLFCSFLNLGNISIGSGLWKFSNSLISNNNFVDEMKTLIQKVIFRWYLVSMDIKKAFDSLDHDFLITVLNKFAFGSNFISWFKLLLKSQQSCVINGGNTTPFFNPISTRGWGGQGEGYNVPQRYIFVENSCTANNFKLKFLR